MRNAHSVKVEGLLPIFSEYWIQPVSRTAIDVGVVAPYAERHERAPVGHAHHDGQSKARGDVQHLVHELQALAGGGGEGAAPVADEPDGKHLMRRVLGLHGDVKSGEVNSPLATILGQALHDVGLRGDGVGRYDIDVGQPDGLGMARSSLPYRSLAVLFIAPVPWLWPGSSTPWRRSHSPCSSRNQPRSSPSRRDECTPPGQKRAQMPHLMQRSLFQVGCLRSPVTVLYSAALPGVRDDRTPTSMILPRADLGVSFLALIFLYLCSLGAHDCLLVAFLQASKLADALRRNGA